MTAEAQGARASSNPGGLVRRCRAAYRFVLGIGATIALSCLWFGGLPLAWGSDRRRRRWSDFVFRSWARAMLRATRIQVTVTGTPPAGPCFLVANHLGYADVFVIAAHVDCRFVAIRQMTRWPLFGFMAQELGTIFIDRSRKREIPAVNAEVERAFEEGNCVVIFPEGRQSNGASVLPFRSALLEPAARGAHPVAWAAIGYATSPGDPPASQSVAWVGRPILEHARSFLALRRVEATLSFGEGFVRDGDRKHLAEELHALVAGAFRPLE